ncbi:MAG: HAD family hydrolase [Candidatus Omnitrophica bacterium]|nr:HAD family hydrolase [Candidatus Omnitrophota bacterium]MDD5352437.1 HAD family hydrolase [Candidatus Omnitrophota bacterium]MDD5550035.1 HAD family hydrolase [Candidatus Omnitrophota bacterium]
MSRLVFLDRDGVINKYPGHFKYVCSQEEFKFLPKAKEAIKRLSESGYKLFVISNQAGVTKGLYSQEILDNITRNMTEEIDKAGGKIEKVLYCIHTEEQDCGCRKPKTGLIEQALNSAGDVDIKNSFFIGDSIRDIKTGKAVGCKTILVLSGREKMENAKEWQVQPDFIAVNLYKASDIIINLNNKK